jgi:hypothetical protein
LICSLGISFSFPFSSSFAHIIRNKYLNHI